MIPQAVSANTCNNVAVFGHRRIIFATCYVNHCNIYNSNYLHALNIWHSQLARLRNKKNDNGHNAFSSFSTAYLDLPGALIIYVIDVVEIKLNIIAPKLRRASLFTIDSEQSDSAAET
jgi:hypothetical protein